MAMVNQMIAPVMAPQNMKDSRWLTLEVCREYQRNKCTRSDLECKFAHPPAHVEVQNGRVTCCFDSIKGKCQRKEPPCKYLHPPQHLREQLLQNGRNNLILRNLQMQALTTNTPGLPPVMPGMYPSLPAAATKHPYASSLVAGQYPFAVAPQYMMPANAMYMNQMGGQLAGQLGLIPGLDGAAGLQGMTSLGPMAMGNPVLLPQKVSRPDRLESQLVPSTPGVSMTSTSPVDANSWTGGAAALDPTIVSNSSQYSPVYFQSSPMVEVLAAGKKRTHDPTEELLLGMPGMMPMMKRAAFTDVKSGMPVYATGAGANPYQHLIAMQPSGYGPIAPFAMMPSVANGHHQMALIDDTVPGGISMMMPPNGASFSSLELAAAGQSQGILPVCRDFKLGLCKRPRCKYIHIMDDGVDVNDGKVQMCRDAMKGKCTRPVCRYYHPPSSPTLTLD